METDLLKALKKAIVILEDHNIDEMMAGEFEILTDVVAQAENKRRNDHEDKTV